jgi:ABC-type multidrug transport system permease subunit
VPISRVLFFYHFFTALPFYLLALACGLGYLWETGRAWRVMGYLAFAIGAFVYFYPFVSGQPVPGSQASMFFILPTWQFDCQFYPLFVCPLNAPADVPIVAIALRIAGAGVLAGIAAAAFFVLIAPARALATARGVLGRGARGRGDAR